MIKLSGGPGRTIRSFGPGWLVKPKVPGQSYGPGWTDGPGGPDGPGKSRIFLSYRL